ncbi:MAG TPA: helix-turn-helix domain-containing protein, partial [Planctomycetota bacterium]|nr:helix-turn-helix domain-containing protein [Planctomycetota bacterium]
MFEEYQDILTTDELAQILRLNERTVIKLAKEGQLPAAKIASQFRFSKEKILEWLELQMNHYSDDLLADMEKGMLEKAVPVHKLLVESHI